MSDPGMIAAGQAILAQAGRQATPEQMQEATDETGNADYSKYLTPASRPYAIAELAKRKANKAGIQQQIQPAVFGPQKQLDELLKNR